jgi:hypothetical protein
VLPFTVLMVFTKCNCGDFFLNRSLRRLSLHQDSGRPETAGDRFARNDKEPGRKTQLPAEELRETAET